MFAQDARGYALSLLLFASSACSCAGIRGTVGPGRLGGLRRRVGAGRLRQLLGRSGPLAHGASLRLPAPAQCTVARLVLTAVVSASSSSAGPAHPRHRQLPVELGGRVERREAVTTVRADIPHPVIDLAVVVVVASWSGSWAWPGDIRGCRSPSTSGPIVFACAGCGTRARRRPSLPGLQAPLVVRYLVDLPSGLRHARRLRPVPHQGSRAIGGRRGRTGGSVGSRGRGPVRPRSSQDWRGAVASVADRASPVTASSSSPHTRILPVGISEGGAEGDLTPLPARPVVHQRSALRTSINGQPLRYRERRGRLPPRVVGPEPTGALSDRRTRPCGRPAFRRPRLTDQEFPRGPGGPLRGAHLIADRPDAC